MSDELEHFAMLEGVALGVRRELLVTGKRHALRAGEALIVQGKVSGAMYFVLEGELAVALNDPLAEPIAVIGRGETVGELGVLDGSVASAHVIARTDARLLALDEEAFWALTHSSHAFAIHLLVKLAERLRANNATVSTNIEKRRLYERAAMFDGLTGIHNRRWLDDTLHRLVERHSTALRERADGKPIDADDNGDLSVALIDIDHFKSFNDGHGHDAGDAVLSAVAARLAANLRPTDLVARMGGEEFVILFPNTGIIDAAVACERVRLAVAACEVDKPTGGGTLPRVTISIGVAELHDGQSPADILKAADAAMYRAKKGGRNRVVTDGSRVP
jgi:diguanylate cyclase (GGDEF)-like protein